MSVSHTVSLIATTFFSFFDWHVGQSSPPPSSKYQIPTADTLFSIEFLMRVIVLFLEMGMEMLMSFVAAVALSDTFAQPTLHPLK